MTSPDADLKSRFDAAVSASKQLPERPDNATLLQIYALFKQATEGDVDGDKPGAMDFVGMAKWNARETLRGTSPAEAMQRYVGLIESLQR